MSSPHSRASQQAQPFHEGERLVQSRAGVRNKIEEIGSRVFRDFMPEQHREFFRQLPFVLVGSIDAGGQPWASVLANPPGFIESPDPRRLVIRARPLGGDPLNETLTDGASIGLLGIEPHTRRRNRMNGVVEQVMDASFTVGVRQSFGNCPKYIQARRPAYSSVPRAMGAMRSDRLDEDVRAMILRADTFFIATAHPAAATDEAASHGVDVSHRGAKPGFVRVDDERTLTIPDFSGNFFFNTLGNIAVNPKAGLLFLDFTSGDLAYLAVDAEIIWDGSEVAAFAGAQRLLRLRVRAAIRVEASLPLRWGEAERSPFLEGTGAWKDR